MGVGQPSPRRGVTCIIHPSRLLGSSSKHAMHCRVDRYTGGTSGPVSSPSRLVSLGKVQSQLALSAKDSWPAGIPVRSLCQRWSSAPSGKMSKRPFWRVSWLRWFSHSCTCFSLAIFLHLASTCGFFGGQASALHWATAA